MYNHNQKSLLENKIKSENTNELNLTFISAGALGISISFINTIVPLKCAHWICLLIISWVLLVISLLINLISHKVTAEFSLKSLMKLDAAGENLEAQNAIGVEINSYNKKMRPWDWTAILSLIVAIILLIIFCSLNIL